MYARERFLFTTCPDLRGTRMNQPPKAAVSNADTTTWSFDNVQWHSARRLPWGRW